MNNFFTGFHQFASKRKAFFLIVLICFVILAAYAVRKINLNEDVRSIIPRDKRINSISDALSDSKFSDRLILTFSLNDTTAVDPESLIKVASYTHDILQTDSTHIRSVQFKNEDETFLQVYGFIFKHLPLYLSEEDYVEIEKKIQPHSIEQSMETNYKSLTSLAGLVTKDFIFKDPLSITPIALKQLEQFQLDDNFTIYNNCIFTKDLKHLLIFVEPVFPAAQTRENSHLIDFIDETLSNTRTEFPHVYVEYYGGTAVAVINAATIKKDIVFTVSLAFIALFILFIIMFRKLKHILLIFFPIVLGMLFAIAIISLSFENISAISLGIGAILIGISLDYSLHMFTHYRSSGSMIHSIGSISKPVMMSCLSTAAAFLCLFIVKSDALNQLGLFSALAIFFTALVVLLVVPFFYKTNQPVIEKKKGKTLLDKIAAYEFEKNTTLLIVIFIFSIVFLFTSGNLGFNSDLNTMNYQSDELKIAEKNLKAISSEANSAVYVIVQGSSWNEVILKAENNEDLIAKAESQKLISSVSSPVNLVPSKERQIEKIERWNRFWDEVGKEKVKALIIEKSADYYFRPEAFHAFFELLDYEFKPIEYEDFAPVSEIFLSNYLTQSDSIYSAITIVKAEQKKKNDLFRFLSTNPDVIIFDNQHFANQFLKVLKDDFRWLVYLSITLVFLILLMFFGRIEMAIIAFFPIMLSWLWTIGLMGVLGIEFNIFNIIISTFILGLGVDYSIFIISGILRNYMYGGQNITPYRLSVLLSALTTIIALGVLLFARHPAMKSIALVSIVGIFSVIIISFTVLPHLFKFIILNKGKPRSRPVTMQNFLVSVYTFIIYTFGSVLFTIMVPIVITLPVRVKYKKFLIHRLIRFGASFIVYANFTIKKRYINLHKLDFSKPAVIVSNHQSHLDLMILLLLNPKIVALTNKWVWNSPFFGLVIRYAGFYPAFRGINHDYTKLEEKIKDGYSVLVFPEGTRSIDGSIGRMHQGAFFIAGKYNLDIQPIILHGINHLMQKNEFFLKSGQGTIKVLDRIKVKPANITNNETYRQEAKDLTKFYRTEYEKLRKEIETPTFFKQKLIAQYIYKGPILEWYMRIKLKLENYYDFFHQHIPEKGTITDIGCGYGFMSYMLSFLSKDRIITGIDYDNEKIMLAANCAGKNKKINFIAADIFELEIEPQDAFILSDVLHYFNEEKQEKLITKCIESLNPGGTIIIRDADSGMKKRHLGTRYTEFFSTKTGFNKMGEGRLYFTSAEKIKTVVSHFNLEMEIIDNTKLTSNIVFIIRKPVSYEN